MPGFHYTITLIFTEPSNYCISPGKESTCNAGDPGLIPGSGRYPGEGIGYPLQYSWASLVAQLVKNLPAMQKTCIRSLSLEDTLEKWKASHSIILAWRIHGLYSPWGHKELDVTEWQSRLRLSCSFLFLPKCLILILPIFYHELFNICWSLWINFQNNILNA